mmetsp:Transcript_25286/g.72915  ORF Transcript_25286/g.72915 Transcript_25286/m.72915 type:complete len:202 (-) Transcript_25286:3-608(-)
MVIRPVGVAETNILRLQVPVRDPSAVRILQGAGDLLSDPGHFGFREAGAFGDAIEDLAARAILHDDPNRAAVLVSLKDLAYVRVVKLLHEVDLPFEEGPHLPVVEGELLDSHLSPNHLLVFAEEDLSIGSCTDFSGAKVVPPGDLGVLPLRHKGAEVEETMDLACPCRRRPLDRVLGLGVHLAVEGGGRRELAAAPGREGA